jgi:hypothetical protein
VATVVRIGARAVALWALLALITVVVPAAAVAASAGLPDGRRYELVSPPSKNGVEVIPQTQKTHVRPDGNLVTFSALGGFGSLEGSSLDFEYMSERTGVPDTSGWSTHGINPPERGATFSAANGNTATFVNGFTSNLSVGIYRAWRPLVNAPNVAAVSNLYRITGLNSGPRTVQLMSDSVDPIPPDWSTFGQGLFLKLVVPQFAGVSSDLSHVMFESRLQLTPDAQPYQGFLCVIAGLGCVTQLYENVGGTVRFVGRIPQAPDTSCDDANGPACVAAPSSQAALGATDRFYSQLAISQDGTRIYFQAPVGGAGGALYLREDGVRTEEIAANGVFWSASADGSHAFFTTNDALLPADTDGAPDLYMYDRGAPGGSRLTLISAGSAGIDGYLETVVGSSPDGEYVYFVCDGQLIAGESPADIMGLYVWHDGQLRFIGSFPDSGAAGANSPRNVWEATSTARTSRITPDGRHLLFTTTSGAGFVGRGGFTGYDHRDHRELYLYSADSGRLVCVSCNPTGRGATTHAVIDVRENAATSQTTSDSAQALSDDGRRVFFSSAEALVAEDTNGRADAYEYDTQSGSVHLLSSGKSADPSYLIDATANGNDVFIVTRERLVGWDVDNRYDLYDVRVGGGFPEPVSPAPACSGEGCLGDAPAAPSADDFADLGVRGAGDTKDRLRTHRRCGRRAVLRTVRGKRRCVRRGSHRRARRAKIRGERSAR